MTLEEFYQQVRAIITSADSPEYKEEYIWELCEQYEYENRGDEDEV